jgi:hypothetical protein
LLVNESYIMEGKYLTRGLVVEPTIVIASPIEGMNNAARQQKVTIKRVSMKLSILLGFLLMLNSSSIESLAGKMLSGEATSVVKIIVRLAYKF